MSEPTKIISIESKIERSIRKYKFIVPILTLVTVIVFYWLIILCHNKFLSGTFWTVIPAAIFVHSFLILTIHEAAHQNITRTSFDRFILNLAPSLVFIPFYGEHYRKYHLIHHGNTNSRNDPISPPIIRKLYKRNRYLYIILELMPLLFTIYLMINYRNIRKEKIDRPFITINKQYFIFSLLTSVLLFFLLKPNILFLIGTLLILNVFSTVRNWCEHMGTAVDRCSNTYWFPLGMGIGNHDLHHQKSSYSWISLMIGLYYKSSDTNPFKCVKGILFERAFTFYNK